MVNIKTISNFSTNNSAIQCCSRTQFKNTGRENSIRRVSFSEDTKTSCSGDRNEIWYYLKVMKVVFGRIRGMECLPLEKVIDYVPKELRYSVLSLVSNLVYRYKLANNINYRKMINRKVIVGHNKAIGILKEINGHTSPQRARINFGKDKVEKWIRLSIVSPYVFVPLRPQGSYDNIILNGSEFNKNIISQCDKYIYKFISKTCIVIQTCYRGYRGRINYSKKKNKA